MINYPYSITDDFPNQKINPDHLVPEIEASSIVTGLCDVTVKGDSVSICFDSSLSGADETTLDGLIAAHQGNPTTEAVFHASSKLVEDEKNITSDQTFECVGGSVTSPSFFSSNLAACFGRCIGEVFVDGTGFEMQITETNDADTEDKNVSAFAVADTGGVWKRFKFSTDVLIRTGENTYKLEGRLNGAASAKVRFVSLSLLEVK